MLARLGLRGVYQGLSATLARNIPAVAMYFGVYEYVRQQFVKPGQNVQQLESWKLLTAGAAGGFGYWIATYPIDSV